MRIPHLFSVIAVALGIALLAWLVDNDYYLRILFMMGVYYLCAAGMNVLVGYAGQKSLGQAGLFAAGAYAAALLTTSFDLDPWAALAAAAVVAGLCGVLIAWPSLRVRGPYLAMVTLAFGIVVEKLVSEWTEVFGGAEGIFGIKPLAIAGTPFSNLHWVWFAIALGAATHLLLRNLLCGRFGRAFLSLQADEIAAESVGVSVYRYKILAFVIAAVTCGIAGAMVAQQNQYVNSDFITFHLSIFILLLVLFGGSGNLYGPLIGAVLLTLIDALLAQWPSVQHFAYGALLLFALYLMPNGVAGLLKQLFGTVARKHETLPEPKALKPAAADGINRRIPAAARRRPRVEALRRCASGPGCVLPADTRARSRADRAEWCRKEHDDQHDHGCSYSDLRTHRVHWAGHRWNGKPCYLPHGDRPHVPELAPVREPVSAGERTARTALPDEERLLGVPPRVAVLAAGGG